MSDTQRIRTGIIGFGLSGQVFHSPFIRHHPAYELIAVSTRNREKAQGTLPGVVCEPEAQALLARPDIDLVIVTAPNEFHYPLCRDALLAGKHVLVEKPSVTRVSDIDELQLLAERQNRQFCVYQNRRYDGDFVRLQSLIERRSMGDLRVLDSRYDRFRPEPQDRWREQNVAGGGIFWDLGPHLIDQALALFGRPDAVSGTLLALRDGSQVTDAFEARLHYPNRLVTVGSNPFSAGQMRRFRAGFTGGTWQCWGLDPQESLLREGAQPEANEWAAGVRTVQAEEVATRDSAESGNIAPGDYRRFFTQLADAIRNDAPLPVPGTEARALIEIMETVEQASAAGRAIRLAQN